MVKKSRSLKADGRSKVVMLNSKGELNPSVASKTISPIKSDCVGKNTGKVRSNVPVFIASSKPLNAAVGSARATLVSEPASSSKKSSPS